MSIEIIEKGNKINLKKKFEAECSNCGTRFTFLLRDARNSYTFIECPQCEKTLEVSTCKKIPDEDPAIPTT